MEAFLEWLGDAGRIILAVGAGIGVALGIAGIIWDRFRKKRDEQVQQHVNQSYQHQGLSPPQLRWNPHNYQYGWVY
jgi:NAD-dependent SIR2 family protein deacetylase